MCVCVCVGNLALCMCMLSVIAIHPYMCVWYSSSPCALWTRVVQVFLSFFWRERLGERALVQRGALKHTHTQLNSRVRGEGGGELNGCQDCLAWSVADTV